MPTFKHEISNRGNFIRVSKYTKHKTDVCQCGHDKKQGCIECTCVKFKQNKREDGK